MKIIILGAGQVGSSVAESLVSENNDITLVDTSRQQLELMRERFELRTICGNGASPSILHEAGAKEADLLIAVTQSDQTNLCACRVARSLFNLPTRIARLHSGEFSQYPKLIAEEFAVDFSICPEQIVTDYISRLISFPGALQVLDFANSTISLIAAQAIEGGPSVGQPVRMLVENLGEVETRIVALYRNGFSL
ncbi:MAG: NAD-binding protein, partial [Rhodocyclaceae bacterium]|nr:NAD-binding protein [Rhodocyclaceae bacterium]